MFLRQRDRILVPFRWYCGVEKDQDLATLPLLSRQHFLPARQLPLPVLIIMKATAGEQCEQIWVFFSLQLRQPPKKAGNIPVEIEELSSVTRFLGFPFHSTVKFTTDKNGHAAVEKEDSYFKRETRVSSEAALGAS